MGRYQQLIRGASKIEEQGKRVLEFSRRKSVKRWFMLTVVIFVGLMMAPSQAQSIQDVKLDGDLTYAECRWVKKVLGYPDDVSIEKDMALVGCGNVSTSGLTAVASIGPELATGGEAVANMDPSDPLYHSRTGLLTKMDTSISALMYDPPTVDLVAHMASEWVPGQDVRQNSVYAQSGYDVLTMVNISDIWGKTRMLAYSLFVIALIIAGFMIMFRQKIGGQMAVTIFNTIPKVIVGLILVTFSFAIVGVVIDIGVLLVTIVASILEISDPIVISNPFSLLQVFLRGENGMGGVTVLLGGGIALTLFGALAAPFSGGLSTGLAIGGIAAIIIALAIIALVLYASVKVFITLLKAWVGIIVDTILGPLFLVVAVIPGKSNVGWNWFYRVVKNVLTFVGVFAIINLAGYLQMQNVNFFFPSGLAGGDPAASSMGTTLSVLMNAVLPLFLFFMASEVPNFLDDLIPKDGGKGTATAFGNVQKSFSKVPVVGSAFG